MNSTLLQSALLNMKSIQCANTLLWLDKKKINVLLCL